MNEAREWVRRHRAQERGEILPAPEERESEFEDLRLGQGGMDPTGGESVLDWAIERDDRTPIKFRHDW